MCTLKKQTESETGNAEFTRRRTGGLYSISFLEYRFSSVHSKSPTEIHSAHSLISLKPYEVYVDLSRARLSRRPSRRHIPNAGERPSTFFEIAGYPLYTHCARSVPWHTDHRPGALTPSAWLSRRQGGYFHADYEVIALCIVDELPKGSRIKAHCCWDTFPLDLPLPAPRLWPELGGVTMA